MKRILSVLFICLLLVGCVSHKKDYEKGWVYWFSGYGLHNEGEQYFDDYKYGRHYDDKFSDEKDAFEQGYKDGFYFVNQKEPDGIFIKKMEEGYNQYYQNK